MGTNDGFVVIDIKDPAKPKQVHLNKSCTTSQGDVVVYGNILVRSWDSATSASGAATQSCGGTLVGQGFEGVHIFDITDPTNPVMVDVGNNPADGKQGLRFSTADVPRKGCGSHTATAVPSPAQRRALHLQRRLLRHVHVDGRPEDQDLGPDPGLVRQAGAVRPLVPRQHGVPQRRRTAARRAPAATASRCSSSTRRSTRRCRAASRTRSSCGPSRCANGGGHSAAFSYDGKTVVFGHEPGGGVAPSCQASSYIRSTSRCTS